MMIVGKYSGRLLKNRERVLSKVNWGQHCHTAEDALLQLSERIGTAQGRVSQAVFSEPTAIPMQRREAHHY